ncbi:hypothetical protein ONR75_03220 [Rhodopseudomonas sp. P2A-2r]|uniref:hypothetical protein n=1 Tax=Rhodopseudomonas sp. P2A-2r TaxID=2991972 RepID=UPI0022343F2E|nr:hypothetical protein [Rhodopseudomonas sp. P2A-2r]UZE49822.1 hypothetical protein ONR75_03220 [Rhodopseudomonas sp. P2A-2r]
MQQNHHRSGSTGGILSRPAMAAPGRTAGATPATPKLPNVNLRPSGNKSRLLKSTIVRHQSGAKAGRINTTNTTKGVVPRLLDVAHSDLPSHCEAVRAVYLNKKSPDHRFIRETAIAAYETALHATRSAVPHRPFRANRTEPDRADTQILFHYLRFIFGDESTRARNWAHQLRSYFIDRVSAADVSKILHQRRQRGASKASTVNTGRFELGVNRLAGSIDLGFFEGDDLARVAWKVANGKLARVRLSYELYETRDCAKSLHQLAAAKRVKAALERNKQSFLNRLQKRAKT